MSESEKIAFRKELERNSELQKEYLIYKEINFKLSTMAEIDEALNDPDLAEADRLAIETIKEYRNGEELSEDEYNFIKMVFEMNKEDNQEIKKRTNKRLYYYALALAASLALIFVISKTLVPDLNKIFDSHYSSLEMAYFTIRGEVEELDKILTDVSKYYLKEDYDKADSILTSVGNFDENPELLFLHALCQTGKGEYESAARNFEVYLNNGQEYIIEARWYLGLNYLKNKEIDKAIDQFEYLSEIECMYQEDAGKILHKLKRKRR